MRITKKAVSIVLAIMMVATMMSVMAVSASAATVITTAAELDTLVAGNTYVLGADIDYSEIYTVRNARDTGDGHSVDLKDCTLDLNGHTISTINATVTFAGNGATIKNGTFDLVHKSTAGTFQYGSYAIIIDNKVAGYPESAKVTVTDVVCGGAVNVCGATVELNNVTATTTGSKFYTVWAEQDANVIINSGKYTDNQSGGKGIFNTGKGEEGGAVIDVNGGTFETTNKVVYSAENNESINIAGGIFNKEVPAVYLDEGLETITVDGKNVVVTQGTDPDSVAIVGTTGYTTLLDALDNVPDGGTVTVLQNISNAGTLYADGYVLGGNRTYTVDLGGYTVSGATFSVADGNNVTFTNGTITSASVAIQNAATTTVDTSATVISTVANNAAVYGMDGSNTIINGTVEGNKYGVFLVGTANGTINGSVSGTSRGLYVKGTGTVDVTGTINAGDRGVTVENGATVNLNDGAEVTAPYGVVALKDATVNVNEGSEITSSIHAISGNGTSGDGGYEININGGTITATGNECAIYHPNTGELNISGGTISAESSASAILVKSGTTEISGGTITSENGDAVKYDSTGSGYAPFEKIAVSGGAFSSAIPEEYCAAGFKPVTEPNSQGMYTVEVNDDPLGDQIGTYTAESARAADNNSFGLPNGLVYYNGTLLGVQAKTVAGEGTSAQEGDNNMRYVACLNTEILQNADDYGFVVAKLNDSKDYSNTNIDALAANWGNGEKTLSAKGTSNNVCGNEAYGDPDDSSTDYKYITCAINDVTDSDKFVVRFYVQLDGKYYYAKYTNSANDTYTGCIAAWSDLV